MSNFTRRLFVAAGATMAITMATAGLAQAVDLRIGWQQIVEPSRVPQANGDYEKATGANITWSQFGSGADVVTAIASGAIDIGYVGSSPLTAAASQQLPIETIWIVGNLASAEALAVKGVSQPSDLVGKKIATPFVSTSHYSLLAALKHWNIDPKSVQILNLRPADIAAAWTRGDIDGAYVWDPVLTQLKTSGGKVLTDSAEVATWGAPTFDAWIVRKDFADKNPDVVKAWVKTTAAAYATYLKDPGAWSASSPEAAAIAKLTGAKPEDVPELLKGYVFPTLADEVGPNYLGGATAKAIANTANFLVEQGKISAALPDYSPYVDASFAKAALAQ